MIQYLQSGLMDFSSAFDIIQNIQMPEYELKLVVRSEACAVDACEEISGFCTANK
jgi:hypothetical protein